MTLKSLMSLSDDDVWFCIVEPGFSGMELYFVRMFYNADFMVRDVDVMPELRPYLKRKVGRIRTVYRQSPMMPTKKVSMIKVTLEEK